MIDGYLSLVDWAELNEAQHLIAPVFSIRCPLSLRTIGHLTTIFLNIFRQMIWANAAQFISRHCKINELRVGQIEVGHNIFKLRQRVILA